MSHAGNFFSPAEDQRIVEAIRAAERKTSGEIRVHLEDHCPGQDPFKRATELFAELGMVRTEARNGVLFYLAVQDKRFAVIGDEGIHRAVPPGFWDGIKAGMEADFKQKRFAEGLCRAVREAGQALGEHFPHAGQKDRNELSDELSLG
jgi:uncharacterized membrane protein